MWQVLETGRRFHVFLANFLLRMRRNDKNSTSGQIFNPKFEISMGCFLFEYEIWWASAKIYTSFERKTASVMQNFQNLGACWGGGDHLLTKPRKGTSLADFTRFEPLCVQIRSHVLSLGDSTKKGDTTNSHR